MLSHILTIVLCISPISIVYCNNGCALMCMLRPDPTIRSAGRLTFDRLPEKLLCSHLIYGRASINTRHEIVEGMEGDLPSITSQGNYEKLNHLRTRNPNLSLLLGVESKGDSSMQFLSNPFTRTTFINSLHQHLREHRFDGVFLDIAPNQAKWQYVQLLKDMRLTFGNEANLTKQDRLLIVVSISSYQLEACQSLMSALVKQSDYIYLITESITEDTTHTAYVDPLFPARETPESKTISVNARQAVQIGIPPSKLVIGLHLWAKSYTLSDSGLDQAGSRSKGPGKPGQFSSREGTLTYFEVCEREAKRLGRTPFNDKQTKATSLVSDKDQWMSYNGVTDVYKEKISWVGAQGYAGVGLDSLDADDFFGICEEGLMPLLSATAYALSCYTPPVENITENKTSHKGINAGSSPLLDTPAVSPCMRLCYYRPSEDVSEFQFDSIDVSWCTHVVIGPATFKSDGSVTLSPAVSLGRRLFDEWTPSGPKPRFMIAIGADQTADEWRALLSSEKARYRFAEMMNELMSITNAGGVDLMWIKGLDSRQTGFNKLLKELRGVMKGDQTQRLLVVSVLPNAVINDYYGLSSMKDNVDVFHVLGHLFHNANSPKSGHHASLFTSSTLEDGRMSLSTITSKLISEGVTPLQIVISATAEAMVQNLDRVDVSAIPRVGLATTGPGRASKKTNKKGVAAYFEVWQALDSVGARYEWLNDIGVPIGVMDDQYFAYDNAESVALKARWASLEGFGGVSLWALEYDDPWGLCPGGFRFPLLQTLANNHICSRCLDDKPALLEEKCKDEWSIYCDYHLISNETIQYLSPESLPLEKCTHMIIRDVTMDVTGALTVPGRGTDTADYERSRKVSKLHKTKLIVSVKCNMKPGAFSAELRIRPADFLNKMISSLSGLVRDDELDGIELDCDSEMGADVKDHVASFLTRLQTNISLKPFKTACPPTLGLRIPGWRLNLEGVYDMLAISTSVSRISLEGFRYSSPNDATVKAHSPLYKGYDIGQLSVHDTIEAWRRIISPSKIILMLPGYPTMCHLKDNARHEPGSPAHGSDTERVVDPPKISYTEMCKALMQGNLKRGLSIAQVANYAYGADNRWIAYESPSSISFKVNFAWKHKLGGIGISSLNDEDAFGKCNMGYFPLLNAAQSTC